LFNLDLSDNEDQIETPPPAKKIKAEFSPTKIDKKLIKIDRADYKIELIKDNFDQKQIKIDQKQNKIDRKSPTKVDQKKIKKDKSPIKIERIETNIGRIEFETKSDPIDSKIDPIDSKIDPIDSKIDPTESEEEGNTAFDYDSASNHSIPDINQQKVSVLSIDKSVISEKSVKSEKAEISVQSEKSVKSEEINSLVKTKSKGSIKVTIEKAGLKKETNPNVNKASVSLLKASLLKKPPLKTMPPLSSLLKQPVVNTLTAEVKVNTSKVNTSKVNTTISKPKSTILMNSLLKQSPTVKITKKEKPIVPPLPPSISLTPAIPKIKVADLLQAQQPTVVQPSAVVSFEDIFVRFPVKIFIDWTYLSVID
jgi:hypothetical protein